MTGRFNNHLFFVAALSVIMAVSACSVKEDRSVCPSVLRVIIDDGQVAEALDSVWVSIFRDDEGAPVVRSLESVSDLVDGLVDYEVPRGGRLLVVVTSGTQYTLRGDCLFPEDASCMLEGFSCIDITADCEGADTHVSLRRDFMKVTAVFDSPVEGCVMTVRASFSGLSVPEGRPVGPEYAMQADALSDQVFEVCIPRQTASSEIVLSVDIDVPSTGETVRLGYFVLGDLLLESGYDWTEDILRDVTVTFGADMLIAGVSVNGWNPEEINPVIGLFKFRK